MRAAICFLALASMLSAQEGATKVPPVRPFHLPPRIGVITEARLTLSQTLRMALSNNRDIDSSRIDQDKAALTLLAARGVYDPRIGGDSYFLNQTTAAASSLSGSPNGSLVNKTLLGDPQFSGSTPWFGGSYRLDYSSSRATTNNQFITLNPEYPASFNASYTQPLWRGLRYDDNRHRIDVAKKNRALTDQQFLQRVMQVVTQAEQSYWDLVFAYRNLDVQIEAVRLGREQDESNRRQEQQGLLAPIDVVAAQTQLSTFELNAYTAQQTLTIAENAVKVLILADRNDPIWTAALLPVTPVNLESPIVPLADALTEALNDRPEMAEVHISGEINKSDVKYYREQTKPQLDAILTHTSSGLAGVELPAAPNPLTSSFVGLFTQVSQLAAIAGLAPLPPISLSGSVPPALVGGYGQSASNLFRNAFPTNQVELRFSLPLRNRTADANLQSSIDDGRKIHNQQLQTELAIEADVRNAMQAVESNHASVDAARIARQSAEEQYQSEQRQFHAGTSTLFLVQQRQTAMITARSQEQRAETNLAKAIAAFQLSTGQILRENKVDVK
jgi:HAE1 family hydrophobic/amphiphilic exporter-1